MDADEWEERYAKAYESISSSISNVRGVFVAYNSNIDAIKHIHSGDIERLLKNLDIEKVQEKIYSYPRQIDTPYDFLARLLIAMRDGKAAEVPTYSTDIHEWLTDNFVFDSARMGGQAGIISNLLASMDMKRVIAYIPWLSREQANYFVESDNLVHPIVRDGKLELLHPTKAYNPEYKSKVNWIIEFPKDLKVNFGEEQFIVPRNNRLIISSRPPWIRIDISDEVYSHLTDFCGHVDGAILSGYQMIKEDYEDGTTYKDHVKNSVDLIESLKACNPDVRIHVEFTSIQNKTIRSAILNDIVKSHVHSLGLDTVEVANALNVLGHEELAYSVISKGENAIISLYEGAVRLLHGLKLERIHIHSLGYYICVASTDCPVTPEDHLECLLFSSCAAASRAIMGDIKHFDDIEFGLDVRISQKGMDEIEKLGTYLVRQGVCSMDEFRDGCIRTPHHDVLVNPTKVVEDPVGTVGIGDAISASAFVAMLSKM
ncbi:ADP-dependent phosphofructokinase/glucokinase [Methanohalophilus levihalophilus]|uniref:ADP-specific phosphofructokinase n=1 Tax=Methanohalophilus levihalophilus TaxID=1431282 RepID=UPI001AE8F13D|nr:ADP-specific phosphofructokinase [Methanohalophilus levihalophilus]MBP2030926.1 ADP-dependent phosphofructokinase/glucokinase [Methanohalophilus levihalophilus]